MKRIACSALVFGVVFACGDGHGGFGDPGGVFVNDGGVDASSICEGTVRCSRDLRSVVDGCDESVVLTTCAPNEGCGKGQCVPACAAAVSADATTGCEFVALPPPPTEQRSRGSCFAALLANTWEAPAGVAVEYDGQPFDVTKIAVIVRTDGAKTTYESFNGEMRPGEVMAIFLSQSTSGTSNTWVPCPSTAAVMRDTAKPGTRRAPTFRIKTTMPVSAYSLYPFGGSASTVSGATMLLPLASWKTDYIITSPADMFYFAGANEYYYPTTQIVAAEDDTEVSIVGSVHIAGGPDVDGAAKGTAHTYRLRRGEQIQFSQEQQLTGTRASANKPIGVWAGHQVMQIPIGYAHGDASQTELFPVRAWGREYVLAPYISRSMGEVPERYLYRLTGAVDGTVLTYEPRQPVDAPTLLAAGESVVFESREPFIMRSQDIDHPFAVHAYMTGSDFAGAIGSDGDPEFVTVIPSEQYLSRYVFFVDPMYRNSHLVVVRSREAGKDFQPVSLNCVGTLEGWAPIGTAGKYEFTRVWLTRRAKPQKFGENTCSGGRYAMDSKGPFAVTVWGTDETGSYAYPGGGALRPLNRVETVPVVK